MTRDDIDSMAHAYIVAALWTVTDYAECGMVEQSGEFDPSPYLNRVSRSMRDDVRATCERFYDANAAALADWTPEQAGHDLCLTRNHHGTGFWDRDIGTKAERDALTAAAHAIGERNVYRHRGWFNHA